MEGELMEVRAIKHAIKLSEWKERIQACRSSGKTITAWCEENRINTKTYYRWERLYMAETSEKLRTENQGLAPLVKVEPEKLALRESTSYGNLPGIVLRHGLTVIELPAEMDINTIAMLVSALNGHA